MLVILNKIDHLHAVSTVLTQVPVSFLKGGKMEEAKLYDQGMQLDERKFVNSPTDSGRLLGLYMLVGVGVAVFGFSVIFPHSYVREVNGPVAGALVAILAGVLWGATHYAGTAASNPDIRLKVAGIKTAMVFGLATGAIVAVASYAYRGQTGGLQINGIESSLAILVWFAFSTVVQKVKITLGNQ